MKRTTILTLLSVTLLLFAISCDDDVDSSGYCDDSGCWTCDGDYCWPVDNEPCGEGDTCSADQICVEFGCANLCQHESECGLGETCLPAGYCGPQEAPETRCESDEECGNGTICEYSEALSYHICVPGCGSDEECADGEVCAACGRCVPEENPVCGDSKVFCERDEECGSKVCSVDFKCALECDTANPLCPTGQICSDNVCIDDPDPQNPECVFDAQCENGRCLNAYCHTICEQDEECGYGEFCHLGMCKADYRPDNE